MEWQNIFKGVSIQRCSINRSLRAAAAATAAEHMERQLFFQSVKTNSGMFFKKLIKISLFGSFKWNCRKTFQVAPIEKKLMGKKEREQANVVESEGRMWRNLQVGLLPPDRKGPRASWAIPDCDSVSRILKVSVAFQTPSLGEWRNGK